MQLQELPDASAHSRQIARAERAGGYLHQELQRCYGIDQRVVESIPAGTGLYLLGEGRIVHAYDQAALQAKQVQVVAVDRDLPMHPVGPVQHQVQCDLETLGQWCITEASSTVRTTLEAYRSQALLMGLPQPGGFVASHIGRYLPETAVQGLLKQASAVLVPGGQVWILDMPLAARKGVLASPGFTEAYQLLQHDSSLALVADEVIAPVMPKHRYHAINDMRQKFGVSAEHDMFFRSLQQGETSVRTVPVSKIDESQFRIDSNHFTTVVGWGVRCMQLTKRCE